MPFPSALWTVDGLCQIALQKDSSLLCFYKKTVRELKDCITLHVAKHSLVYLEHGLKTLILHCLKFLLLECSNLDSHIPKEKLYQNVDVVSG